MKDTKGLGYLAHLLRHSATEFHVLDLAGGIGGQREEDQTIETAHGLPRGEEDLAKAGIHIASLGDAGEMLDEQAKAPYRHRLLELREELEGSQGSRQRRARREGGSRDRRADERNSRAPSDSVDGIVKRRQLRNALSPFSLARTGLLL